MNEIRSLSFGMHLSDIKEYQITTVDKKVYKVKAVSLLHAGIAFLKQISNDYYPDDLISIEQI